MMMTTDNYDSIAEQFAQRLVTLVKEKKLSIESTIGINNYYMMEHASTEDPTDVLMIIAYILRDSPKLYYQTLAQMSDSKAILLNNKIIIMQLMDDENFPNIFKRISDGNLDVIKNLKYLQQEHPEIFAHIIKRYKKLGYSTKIFTDSKISPYVEYRKKIPTKASTRKPKKVVKHCKCKK